MSAVSCELVSQGTDLPVVAWKLKRDGHWSFYDRADRLRDRGWQVPAYWMPANRQDLVVQRAVIRNGFTRDMVDILVKDIRRRLDWFSSQPGLKPNKKAPSFIISFLMSKGRDQGRALGRRRMRGAA